MNYEEWIVENNYHIPEIAQGKCVTAVARMVKQFPELSKKGGVVFSKYNLDNYCKYPKQYTHMWCVDKDNNIIDPTKSQFKLIPELEYKELDLNVQHFKCMGCGQWTIKKWYCGKCEWSE